MSSTSETGHAKNAANLEVLNSSVAGFGAAYNPSKAGIKPQALQALQTKCNTALKDVNTALGIYNNVVAARAVAFKPLSKHITRVINSLKATDASNEIISSAESVCKKIQGSRVSSKLTEEEKKELAAKGTVPNEKSSSQMSFDNRIANLDKLVSLLSNVKEYTPNEPELQLAGLIKLQSDLKARNSAVIAAATTLANARNARREIFYKEGAGLVDIALDVKNYAKSAFGATDARYKQISGIKFKRIED